MFEIFTFNVCVSSLGLSRTYKPLKMANSRVIIIVIIISQKMIDCVVVVAGGG